MLKTCTKCGTEKDTTEFYKRWNGTDAYNLQCISCVQEYYKKRWAKYRSENPLPPRKPKQSREEIMAKRKEYRDKNKERLKKESAEYARINKDIVKAKKKIHRTKNKEAISKYSKEYSAKNRYKTRIYVSNKRNTNVQYRLGTALRSRIYKFVKKNKPGSAVSDLGCSLEELKDHLESRFKPGMTWENWGKGPGTWQIDHIMPLTAFDLTNRQHFVLAVYYQNLQPLWSDENIRKLNKIPDLEQLFYAAA